MITVNSPEWCLYGNGKDVAIVTDETSFLLENVLLASMDYSIQRDIMDIGMMGGKVEKLVTGVHVGTFNLEMHIMGGIITGALNLADFKTANNMSVTELFKAINKKLNKRGKKNG